ncbi:MAG: biopolymer transporter ExbD [Sphaerochaeta sp.]|nr:biopolymer transporter ExbD [Sphaerochaeta sp.]MCI2097802.1 biopolymer transporter ExbD [Sphaerochaeta sp.]
MEHKHVPQTSMGDIAFLLLLFFLVFAITTKTVPAQIDEAESLTYEQLTETYPTVYLASDGTIYYQEQMITPEQLPSVPEANLMADKATPFSLVEPVITQLKENGVTTLHLLVEAEDAR